MKFALLLWAVSVAVTYAQIDGNYNFGDSRSPVYVGNSLNPAQDEHIGLHGRVVNTNVGNTGYNDQDRTNLNSGPLANDNGLLDGLGGTNVIGGRIGLFDNFANNVNSLPLGQGNVNVNGLPPASLSGNSGNFNNLGNTVHDGNRHHVDHDVGGSHAGHNTGVQPLGHNVHSGNLPHNDHHNNNGHDVDGHSNNVPVAHNVHGGNTGHGLHNPGQAGVILGKNNIPYDNPFTIDKYFKNHGRHLPHGVPIYTDGPKVHKTYVAPKVHKTYVAPKVHKTYVAPKYNTNHHVTNYRPITRPYQRRTYQSRYPRGRYGYNRFQRRFPLRRYRSYFG